MSQPIKRPRGRPMIGARPLTSTERNRRYIQNKATTLALCYLAALRNEIAAEIEHCKANGDLTLAERLQAILNSSMEDIRL